jgi:hypothetical protein
MLYVVDGTIKFIVPNLNVREQQSTDWTWRLPAPKQSITSSTSLFQLAIVWPQSMIAQTSVASWTSPPKFA